MIAPFRLFRFRHLRTRLAVLYAGLFVVALLVVAISTQIMVQRQARESVRAELTTSGAVYDRIWALKARSLAESAGVLARDFGFRMAVASGDKPTIVSAIQSMWNPIEGTMFDSTEGLPGPVTVKRFGNSGIIKPR